MTMPHWQTMKRSSKLTDDRSLLWMTNRRMVIWSNRWIVESWKWNHGRVVETSNCQVVESSNGGMVESSSRCMSMYWGTWLTMVYYVGYPTKQCAFSPTHMCMVVNMNTWDVCTCTCITNHSTLHSDDIITVCWRYLANHWKRKHSSLHMSSLHL